MNRKSQAQVEEIAEEFEHMFTCLSPAIDLTQRRTIASHLLLSKSIMDHAESQRDIAKILKGFLASMEEKNVNDAN